MSFKDVKQILKTRCSSIKGFTKEVYSIILADRKTAFEMADRGENVQEFYKTSATAHTDFYINNGGAYCELLSILS